MIEKSVRSVKRALISLRDQGAGVTLCRVLHRFRIISVFHPLDFYVLNLSTDLLKNGKIKSRGLKFLEIREIYSSEFERWSYADGLQSLDWMKTQFEKGSRLFAAFDNHHTVVAVNWVNSRYASLDYIKWNQIVLAEGLVYVHSGLAARQFCYRGAGSLVFRYMSDVLHNEGFRFAVSSAFLENRAAPRWHRRQGFKHWGQIIYLNRGDREFRWRHLNRSGMCLEFFKKNGREYGNDENSKNSTVRFAEQVQRGWQCLHTHGVVEAFGRTLHRFRIVSIRHSLEFYIKDLATHSDTRLGGEEAESEIHGEKVIFREILSDVREKHDIIQTMPKR